MKKTILIVIAVILIEIVAVIIGAYPGIPNVSATKPEGSIADTVKCQEEIPDIANQLRYIEALPGRLTYGFLAKIFYITTADLEG